MRHLIDILDLRVEEIDALIAVGMDIDAHPERYVEVCKHKILATLFFEPSTRTRLSFEAAMCALGGSVIGFSSADTSSATKGESVADTILTVGCYADIAAMRHPQEGAPLAAAMRSNIPVINGGDGGHHHPTQTLTDLLTIYAKKGRIDNLTIGICGDLKFGRTVHSLINAMSRYEGIEFVFISPEELELPQYMKQGVLAEGTVEWREVRSLEEAMGELDILYMTRIQGERFDDREAYERLKDSYILDMEKLCSAKEDLIIMHPLPRVNEIAIEVDFDPRAVYIEQMRYGKIIRMALIMKLLSEESLSARNSYDYEPAEEKLCANPKCVVNNEDRLEQYVEQDAEGNEKCAFCETPIVR